MLLLGFKRPPPHPHTHTKHRKILKCLFKHFESRIPAVGRSFSYLTTSPWCNRPNSTRRGGPFLLDCTGRCLNWLNDPPHIFLIMVFENNLIPGAGDLQAKDPPVFIPEKQIRRSWWSAHVKNIIIIIIKMTKKIYFPGHKESCVVKEGAEADGDE